MMSSSSSGPIEVSIADAISNVSFGRPHVVLLGAGASKAAIPDGDKNGMHVPLLRDVAIDLDLFRKFPDDLGKLAETDFEAAYSRLADSDAEELSEINDLVSEYFTQLELPDEPNLYDVLQLCLREKDAIFTFNWDPFLIQSRIRLADLGVVSGFPKLFFLHGNVMVGYCHEHEISGILGRRCSKCLQHFEPSQLLFPVEKKNYQDGGLIEREWQAARVYLENCFMLTVFGYSAPGTDVEAEELLKQGWGDVKKRSMEQTEIINRPGSDHEALRATWSPFIHTHHYEIHDDFYESWLGSHPRRSGEAFLNQYIEALFVTNNSVPQSFDSIEQMTEWFKPLLDAETSTVREGSQHDEHEM